MTRTKNDKLTTFAFLVIHAAKYMLKAWGMPAIAMIITIVSSVGRSIHTYSVLLLCTLFVELN